MSNKKLIIIAALLFFLGVLAMFGGVWNTLRLIEIYQEQEKTNQAGEKHDR